MLEDHPGVAGLLKTRDPLGPHSLALAEAVLLPLRAAGFPHRDAGLAFFLIVDYTIGFEASNPRISINEQRVRDATTRKRLHEFFRSLPGDRFPTLIASASTSGSTTGTSDSPQASMCSSTGSSRPNTQHHHPADRPGPALPEAPPTAVDHRGGVRAC